MPVAACRFAGLALAMALSAAPAMSAAQAAQPGAHEELMNRMAGRWTMTGTIGKTAVTHDVDADWILKNEYIRIHEISRDKDPSGSVGYEAWIYVVWDPARKEYAVMWLDNTAATNFGPEGIGHARPDGDRIPFIYALADGTGIHTTFAYDRSKDTWTWTIDNIDNKGASSPFARLTLLRKK
jgi:hypothetical protein